MRTILTLFSVLIAFVLFGLLDSLKNSLQSFAHTDAGATRLFAFPRMGSRHGLPLSIYARLKDVPGVTRAGPGFTFWGTYQNEDNQIPIEAHTDDFFYAFPDLEIPPEQRQMLLHTRTGVVAGERLASKFGWKIGDKIPIKARTVIKKDGSDIWTFDLVGIFRYTDLNMKMFESILFMNWDYFDESRVEGQGTVDWYVLKAQNAAVVDNIAEAVDAISANSDHETKTQSNNSLALQTIKQYGELGFILSSITGAIFFTLLIVAAHTMVQGVQEQIPELAVMKTLGFSGGCIMGLVLCQSILLLMVGAIGGLSVATVAIEWVRSNYLLALPIIIQTVSAEIWLRGVALAVATGLVVGAFPALRGLRLRVVDALLVH